MLWGFGPFFYQISNLLIKKPCFLDSSTQNHAESCGNYLKHAVSDPKRAKLNQNSDFDHVRTYSWLHKLRNTQGKVSTGLRPPRHRALTAISILDMAFAVEPVVWATSQNLNDHAWCNVHASPLDQAGVGPRTASVYIYDGVKKSENGGTIFVAKS